MEHFPLPHGASIKVDERARCIAEPYDGGPFQEYPSRSRFAELYSIFVKDGEIKLYPLPSENAHLLADLEIFLETWLFFGLIREMFGDMATPDLFIDQETNPSQPLLTTTKLPQIVKAWVALKDRRVQADLSLFTRLNVCIKMSSDLLVGVTQRPITADLNILRVIASLGETLEHVVRGASGLQHPSTSWPGLRQPLGYLQAMEISGLCPMLVQKSERRSWTGLSSHYYLSKLKNLDVNAHNNCTKTACDVSLCGSRGSPVAHRCAEKSCSIIRVDEARVQDILGTGSTALLDMLHYEPHNNGKPNIVSSNAAPRYVALSHVWADGLGNPNANALPECQLVYLANIVKSMEQESSPSGQRLHLWLDTLCCPVNSDCHRNLCLARMRRIYRDATYVLILDPTLSSIDRNDIDDLEICARVLFSRWTTRLWTLQEGALATDLYIQLNDQAVSAASIAHTCKAMHDADYTSRGLISPFRSWLRTIRSLINPGLKSKATDVVDVISALDGRDVTVSSDEPLCLSTCLGLDQVDIIGATGDARMTMFWRTLAAAGQAIPRDIIFYRGDRLDDHGLRWAAKSLLDQTTFMRPSKIRVAEDRAILSEEGLRLQYSGFRVKIGYPLSLDDIKILEDFNSRRLKGMFKNLPYAMRHPSLGWFFVTPTGTTRPVDVLRGQDGLGVFITTSPLEDFASPETSPPSCVCVAGEITHIDAEVNYCCVKSAHALGRPYAEHERTYETAW